MNPFDYLTERQCSWARRHGITIDDAGYVEHLNDNLFLPLTAEAFREFQGGSAGQPDRRLYAAHSSAALVVNVFNYWRVYDRLRPIVHALCPHLGDCDVRGLRYEARCAIVWPDQKTNRTPPQLDVVIEYRDSDEPSVPRSIAIESKFREPYQQDQGTFADCYLTPANDRLWGGLDPLRQAAEQIHQGNVVFRRLHVAQLIKHILGLKTQYQGTKNFELIYLWYAAPGPEAVQHEEEIGLFNQMTQHCDPRVRFRAINYHDLINNLASLHGQEHGAYVDYLLERYF